MADLLRDRLQRSLGTAYTLERELGGGGMSRVFVARDEALGRDVVVKVLAPELAAGLSAERFAREIRLAAALQEPHIVPVHTAGTTADGLPYYTMPYVAGETLRARLAAGPVPVAEAVAVLRDVATALEYAHGRGVVHRDVKPENVLLSGRTAVVTDFGIAKAIARATTAARDGAGEPGAPGATLTQLGVALGTPAYMAPEQALGDPDADHRADLYAWGVMAWEVIAGAHPFAGCATPHAMIAAHVTEAPPALGAQRPDVPPALAALVMRCLEKNPARRPASASDVLQALDAGRAPAPRSLSAIVTSRRAIAIAALAIAALAVVGAGVAFLARGAGRAPPAAPAAADGPAAKSLAVLPFAPGGGDTANAYFAEGIAEELTTALARLPGLRLAGRSSSARLKQRGASAREVGAALGVGAVLDGTVRRAGGRIRVSAELTSADDGRVLWAESYERELKDVFAVQDDIAAAIVGALQVRLAPGPRAPTVASHGTTDVAAYDLYLRGLQLYRKRGGELAGAERYLTQAIALDPGFARAYATLASVLMVKPYFFDTSMAAVLPRARAAAERAAALDDALPDAHLALGHVHAEAFEWGDAESQLRRAMALDPNSGEAAYRLGTTLLASGRVREAIVALERARDVDPLYPVSAMYLAWALALTGRDAEALAEARRGYDLDPSGEAVNSLYANVLLAAGRRDEAVAHARRMVPRTRRLRRLSYYGIVLGAAGARDDARPLLRRAEAAPAGSPGRNSSLTYLYLAVGDTARALDALERAAAADGDIVLAELISSRFFDSLRGSARFAAAMRRFNLDLARVTAPDGGRSR